MIYFIRAGRTRSVKIGYSKGHPSARLLSLQTGCPERLELIGLCEGSIKDEKAWHRRFAHLRVQGEWFRWTPELRRAAKPHLIETDIRQRVAALKRARREMAEIAAMYPDWDIDLSIYDQSISRLAA